MKNVIIPCIVRTKRDTETETTVGETKKLEEIKEFAEERGIPFFPEISSKLNQNIYELLDGLCETYLKNEKDLDTS